MTNTPNHTDRPHAEFSPSGLKYLAGCPGFQNHGGTSAAAEMGTRIHEALELRDPQALTDPVELDLYEQTVVLEDQFLREFEAGLPAGERVDHNEVRLSVPLGEDLDTYGTCDRLTIYGGRKALLGDYKTGISQIDPPDKNYQAKAYTLGVWAAYPEIDEVTFVFYIPQYPENPTPHHTFRREELPVLQQELHDVVAAAAVARPYWRLGHPPLEFLNPNQNCRFCKHESRCPALTGLMVDLARRISPDLVGGVDLAALSASEPDPTTTEALYTVAKMAENWATSFRATTLRRVQDGLALPTLRLKSMGAVTTVADTAGFLEAAQAEGVSMEALLAVATFPVGKVAAAVGAAAPRGQKQSAQSAFTEHCLAAGVLTKGATRFTLAATAPEE